MLPLVLAFSSAHACPTLATATTSPLEFDVAQVAIVRQGERTTFSVSINPYGDPQGFALVMPVPEVLEQDQVRTLDAEIFATLDGYTAPRNVSDAGCPRDSSSVMDAGASSSSGTGNVDVEANYIVGPYEITILSATESASLATWLDDHAYYLPEGADARLDEYIEAGSYFLAAKVASDAEVANGLPLSPLQVSYQSPVFAIPIRLATLNSPGEQDMVIYAIVDKADGEVGISNYPRFEIPDTCVWGDPAVTDFASFYEEHFTTNWEAQGDAAWAVEFSGEIGSCSPCTGVSPTEEQINELGFVGPLVEHAMTRIHLRYTPEQADQDLSLYASGIPTSVTTSFADDNALNYGCIESFCDGTPTPGHEAESKDDDSDGGDCGCHTGGAPLGGVIAAGMAAVWVRRRVRGGG